jgi:hypothetical protein
LLDGGYDSQRDELSGQGGADTFVQHWDPELPWWPQREELIKDFNSTTGDKMKNVQH